MRKKDFEKMNKKQFVDINFNYIIILIFLYRFAFLKAIC